MDYHVAAAAAGSILGLASFAPYYRDIFKGSTKPHLFTWLLWTLLTGLTALIQSSAGAGIGAVVAGVESASCGGIAFLAISRGEKEITRSDWVCLFLALIAMAAWLFARQPLAAVIFVVGADLLAFIPTFRKSFRKPHEETAFQFGLSAVHWVVSIFALRSLALVEWLYPVAISIMDSSLVAMLLIRRRQLDKEGYIGQVF